MRLLYLMHVDWRWIKQRPHFLAEELGRAGIDVRVLDRRIWRTDILTENESSVDVRALRAAPGRLHVPDRVDTGAMRAQARWATRGWTPDAVWLCHPTLVELLPSRFGGLPLVYDAMDDHAALAPPERADHVAEIERDVVRRADLVLASSQSIQERLAPLARHEPVLVRNGLSGRALLDPSPPSDSTDVMRIGYVGTIGHWFDVDTVVALLRARPDVEVHLYGPLEVVLPSHERLVVHGAVPRDGLDERVQHLHAFLMPFTDCPLVRAIDPVKVYEYLAWRRPAIVCDFAETAQFGDLVIRYRTADELIAIVGSLRGREAAAAPDEREVLDLLLASTWPRRADVVRQSLDRL